MKEIKYIILPTDLYSPTDVAFAEQTDDCRCIFRSYKHAPSITQLNELIHSTRLADQDLTPYIMLADGRLVKINDYSKIYGKWDVAYNSSISLYELSIDDTSKEYMSLIDTKNKIASSKEDSIKNKLEYIQTIMKLTSLYEIDKSIIDKAKNDESVQNAIIDAIKTEREDNGEEEDSIKNELDMVDQIVKKAFPKDFDSFEITKCNYNGKDIDIDDMIMKLASHVFPQFITQVDISTTLDDSYVIESNLGKIVREPGGKMMILQNDD